MLLHAIYQIRSCVTLRVEIRFFARESIYVVRTNGDF